MRHLST